MKTRILFILALTIKLSILSQNTTEIPNSVLDTLYKIERQFLYLQKQDSISRKEISLCDKANAKLKSINFMYEYKIDRQDKAIAKQDEQIKNLKKQIATNKKINKRKRFFKASKNFAVGVLTTGVLYLVFK